MKYPKINIEYNSFLDPIFIAWIRSDKRYDEWRAPDKKDVIRRVENYMKIWRATGHLILGGITKATGLSFIRNQIDIHVVSGNPRPFSFPVIIKSGLNDTEFVETISHELIHCLFKDNRIREDGLDTFENAHILVHAVLKFTYLDILKNPFLLYDNERRSENADSSEYREAWEYVRNHVYLDILKEFRSKVVKCKGT